MNNTIEVRPETVKCIVYKLISGLSVNKVKHGAILHNEAEVFSLPITNPKGRPMIPASSPVVPASFNVTSPVKLVGRTRLGRLAINGKSKMAEPGEESNFSRKNMAVTFRFYHLQ